MRALRGLRRTLAAGRIWFRAVTRARADILRATLPLRLFGPEIGWPCRLAIGRIGRGMLGSHGRALPAPGFGPAIELETLWPPGSGDRLGSRSGFIPLRLVSMASRSAILAPFDNFPFRPRLPTLADFDWGGEFTVFDFDLD